MNLLEDCILTRLSPATNTGQFRCKNDDLNEFLYDDALIFQEGLMGVTYLFCRENDPQTIVCFFTVSNDALQIRYLPNSAQKRIKQNVRREKHISTYPCVKIGRLGVDLKFCENREFQVGKQLMDFIKGWFLHNNKTGCRFIIVDAYNEPKVLKYYERNGFTCLLSETKEKEVYQKDELKTRIMFYDLINLVG